MTFAREKLEALADAGLVQCAACELWDEQHRMRLNADGTQYLCREPALFQMACADEQEPCKACERRTPRKDLDADGRCGCQLVETAQRFDVVLAAVLS
jgi:hypothetical protein